MSFAILVGNVAPLPIDTFEDNSGLRTADDLQQLTLWEAIQNIFFGVIPVNIVEAAASNNVLGIIAFGSIMGMFVDVSGENPSPVLVVLTDLNQIMLQITGG